MFETSNVPCKTNPLGVKGAGEAGAIGSCPAVVNAIVDGLWREYKIDHIDMPATPERVWIAINEHHRQITAAIEAGDADRAAAEMQRHLDFLVPFYEKAWRNARRNTDPHSGR